MPACNAVLTLFAVSQLSSIPVLSPHRKPKPLCYAAGFADLFSVKDDGEVLNAKKAAFLASKVMQSFVVEKIEDIIDKNKKVKHTKLSGETAAAVWQCTLHCEMHSFAVVRALLPPFLLFMSLLQIPPCTTQP
jgi:hypothetical protein